MIEEGYSPFEFQPPHGRGERRCYHWHCPHTCQPLKGRRPRRGKLPAKEGDVGLHFRHSFETKRACTVVGLSIPQSLSSHTQEVVNWSFIELYSSRTTYRLHHVLHWQWLRPATLPSLFFSHQLDSRVPCTSSSLVRRLASPDAARDWPTSSRPARTGALRRARRPNDHVRPPRGSWSPRALVRSPRQPSVRISPRVVAQSSSPDNDDDPPLALRRHLRRLGFDDARPIGRLRASARGARRRPFGAPRLVAAPDWAR